jgi:hypothetical protein
VGAKAEIAGEMPFASEGKYIFSVMRRPLGSIARSLSGYDLDALWGRAMRMEFKYFFGLPRREPLVFPWNNDG